MNSTCTHCNSYILINSHKDNQNFCKSCECDSAGCQRRGEIVISKSSSISIGGKKHCLVCYRSWLNLLSNRNFKELEEKKLYNRQYW